MKVNGDQHRAHFIVHRNITTYKFKKKRRANNDRIFILVWTALLTTSYKGLRCCQFNEDTGLREKAREGWDVLHWVKSRRVGVLGEMSKETRATWRSRCFTQRATAQTPWQELLCKVNKMQNYEHTKQVSLSFCIAWDRSRALQRFQTPQHCRLCRNSIYTSIKREWMAASVGDCICSGICVKMERCARSWEETNSRVSLSCCLTCFTFNHHSSFLTHLKDRAKTNEASSPPSKPKMNRCHFNNIEKQRVITSG